MKSRSYLYDNNHYRSILLSTIVLLVTVLKSTPISFAFAVTNSEKLNPTTAAVLPLYPFPSNSNMCISTKQQQQQQRQRQNRHGTNIQRGGGGRNRRIVHQSTTSSSSSSSDFSIHKERQQNEALTKTELQCIDNNSLLQKPSAASVYNSSVSSSATPAAATIRTMQQRYETILSNPRIMACIYMSISMSLHYSGYEFVRNVALSLFTSNMGYPQPVAYPLMNGLISPISVILLYYYSQQIDLHGPRITLRNFTRSCVLFIVLSSFTLWQCSIWTGTTVAVAAKTTIIHTIIQEIQRGMIGLIFLFNNCYVFMIASQQWSFIDSIVTPNEGAQYFGTLTGICSILCTITAGIIPYILPHIGLIGMYSLTAITLYGTLRTGDYAYHIAQNNGFDPALQQENNKKKKQQQQELLRKEQESRGIATTSPDKNTSRLQDAIVLFKRVPTLRALLMEGISFQSLGTILNVAMIRALQIAMPNNDIARSAYTGRFYSCISGISAIVQFILLPICMKRFESKYLWRFLPILPILVTLYQIFPFSFSTAFTVSISPLTMVAMALFITKIIDYSIRVVIYNMTYQPLDFESRFIGKEIINVLGGRVGRSGMSLLLSAYTAMFATTASIQPLSYLAFTASTIWGVSAYWLSTLLPSKADAQRTVVERQRTIQLEQQQEQLKRQKDK